MTGRGADPGLCGACLHARVVGNRRGSRFWLCGLAGTDPRFPKYPPLPVRACPGFRLRPAGKRAEGDGTTPADAEGEPSDDPQREDPS